MNSGYGSKNWKNNNNIDNKEYSSCLYIRKKRRKIFSLIIIIIIWNWKQSNFHSVEEMKLEPKHQLCKWVGKKEKLVNKKKIMAVMLIIGLQDNLH